MYLLDTNICIYLIRKQSKKLLDKIQKQKITNVGISTVTLAELQYGVEKSRFPERNRQALESFLLPLEVMPFEVTSAFTYGRIRSELEKKGKTIGPLDMMIAAHSLAIEAILVTNNEKEFSRIRELKIENWTK